MAASKQVSRLAAQYLYGRCCKVVINHLVCMCLMGVQYALSISLHTRVRPACVYLEMLWPVAHVQLLPLRVISEMKCPPSPHPCCFLAFPCCCRKDPLTSAPLSEEQVYPNLSMYTAIEEWLRTVQ